MAQSLLDSADTRVWVTRCEQMVFTFARSNST